MDNWNADDYIDWMYTNFDLVLYPEIFLDVKFNDSGRYTVPCLSTICRALEAIRKFDKFRCCSDTVDILYGARCKGYENMDITKQ
jgi:hypothetical protein